MSFLQTFGLVGNIISCDIYTTDFEDSYLPGFESLQWEQEVNKFSL